MRSYVFAGLLGVLAASVAGAQASAPPLPHTPDSCVKALSALQQTEMKKIHDTTLSPRYTQAEAQKTLDSFGQACVAQFDVATLPDSQLLDLAQLYRSVRSDTANAAKALLAMDRALANQSVSPAERLKRLSAGANQYAYDAEKFATVAAITQEIDHNATATAVDKFRAHEALMMAYSNAKMYPQVITEATALEAMGPTLDSATRVKLRLRPGAQVDMTDRKAEAYASMNQDGQAKALYEAKVAKLESIPVKTAADSAALKSAQRYVGRYALVGSTAAPIVGQHWFNAPSGMTQYVPKGKVSLIMITAHWCGPCKSSYPTIARVADEYRPKGVETVLEMKTYGYFEDEKNIPAAREAELDQKFYVDQFKFHTPIAVFEAIMPKDAKPGARGTDPNEAAYSLLGYPTYVIVGRDGIIRNVIVGWGGKASEQKLTTALDKALAES